MDLEFDAEKDAANRAKHGVSLADAVSFEMLAVLEDDRSITASSDIGPGA